MENGNEEHLKKKKAEKKKKRKNKKKDDEDEEDEEKSEELKKKEKQEKQDIICDSYVMLHEMGKGAFGQIFLTYNIHDEKEVATKKEVKKLLNGKPSPPQLRMEFNIYKSLLSIVTPSQSEVQVDFSGKVGIAQEDIQGVPKFYGYGECKEYHYLIMELLGPNLVELFNFCGNRKFTLSTVCMVAIQMLNRIEYFHKNHFVHRDIKPENFVIGCGEKSNIIYLIDFGLCKRYKDPKTHQHTPYREGRLLTGTARYVSINTHLGIEQSRRDDLESIGYLLIFFLKGSLPWQGLKTNVDKYNKIMEKKLQIPTEVLCYGLPDELGYYLNYCKSLRYEDRPDYDYLRGLFMKMLYSSINCYSLQKEHMKFDWCFEDPNTIWSLYNKKKISQKKKDLKLNEEKREEENDQTPYTELGESKPKEMTSTDLQNLMKSIDGMNMQNRQNDPLFNSLHIQDHIDQNEVQETPNDFANQDDPYPGINKEENQLDHSVMYTPEGNFEKTNENNPDYANVSVFDNISHNMIKDENLTVGYQLDASLVKTPEGNFENVTENNQVNENVSVFDSLSQNITKETNLTVLNIIGESNRANNTNMDNSYISVNAIDN